MRPSPGCIGVRVNGTQHWVNGSLNSPTSTSAQTWSEFSTLHASDQAAPEQSKNPSIKHGDVADPEHRDNIRGPALCSRDL